MPDPEPDHLEVLVIDLQRERLRRAVAKAGRVAPYSRVTAREILARAFAPEYVRAMRGDGRSLSDLMQLIDEEILENKTGRALRREPAPDSARPKAGHREEI